MNSNIPRYSNFSSNETPNSRSMSIKSFDIEKESFRIIDSEIHNHNYDLNYEWPIVRRIIHATADFEFASKSRIMFSKDAIESAFYAFSNKSNIITDVNMVLHGISKNSLKHLNLTAKCYISDPMLSIEAKKNNKTRSEMAMRKAYKEIDNGIVVIGNAPTALYEIIRMINDSIIKPKLVVGIPVGFVSAVESKLDLSKLNIPFITNIGRKGGSSVASSIINALMLLYLENKKNIS